MRKKKGKIAEGRETSSARFTGERLRCVAMPLGGVGAGQLALGGDGSLRQWQLFNLPNHIAHVPDTFFAIRAWSRHCEPVARVLQSGEFYDTPFTPVPSVTDHLIPRACRDLMQAAPGVESIRFTAAYPAAVLEYLDGSLPVKVELEAFTPLVPLDPEQSGIPVALFRFNLQNNGNGPVQGHLLGTLQNAVGYDGVSPIKGTRCVAYGGNQNRIVRQTAFTAIAMTTTRLPTEDPHWGEMALAVLESEAEALAHWDSTELLWREFEHGRILAEPRDAAPSRPGHTWNGAMRVPFALEPGQERPITFLIAWFFPNHYLNWRQGWSRVQDAKSRFHVGHAYANRFRGALEVVGHVVSNLERLDLATWSFVEAFHDTTLPEAVKDAVQSNISLVRSPTCIWAADDRFFGFEGCCGASAGGVSAVGGCCPLNCTHVWNYEMTLAALFPSLERSMRETDLEMQMAPEGYVPHRTTFPLYLPRPWNQGIGGPEQPALDGMCGTVLKSYREFQYSQDVKWLHARWPRVKRLLTYLMEHFDRDGDGVIDGEQPNTYDIHVYGPNTFIGSLWLAALLAGEKMAEMEKDRELGRILRDRFEVGSANYDRLLWNGEYYVQKYDARKYRQHQWGKGCHSDQLLGQWWAHFLGLGHVLPREHVRSALRSIFRYNFRRDLSGFRHRQRVFACGKEAGLLNCTWPHGGRPEVPILYCDEVWTGIEYEVAALLLWEGMIKEGTEIVASARERHNGTHRNPFNEIECGDHYARAMASWSLLHACTGFRLSSPEGVLEFFPHIDANPFESLFTCASGWGTVRRELKKASWTLQVGPRAGTVPVRELRLGFPARRGGVSGVSVQRNGKRVARKFEVTDGILRIRLTRLQKIRPGSPLEVTVRS